MWKLRFMEVKDSSMVGGRGSLKCHCRTWLLTTAFQWELLQAKMTLTCFHLQVPWLLSEDQKANPAWWRFVENRGGRPSLHSLQQHFPLPRKPADQHAATPAVQVAVNQTRQKTAAREAEARVPAARNQGERKARAPTGDLRWALNLTSRGPGLREELAERRGGMICSAFSSFQISWLHPR